jgi:hypothetical protein
MTRRRDSHMVATLMTRQQRISWGQVVGAFVAATIAILVLPAAAADAHETGAIHVSVKQVAVGGTVGVRGEKLPKASDLKLEMRGVLDNYPVGAVKTDTGGAFQLDLKLPASVPAGAYTLVVIASDGDVTARADLAVTEGAATTASTSASSGGMSDMPGMANMPGTDGEHATATPMVIARTTTPGEWIVIWLIIIVSLAAGGRLLTMGHAVRTE